MPSRLLYLLRAQTVDPLLAHDHHADDTTVVLLHDAVRLQEVPASRVFALDEDAAARGVSPSVPAISYRDLLELVFEADRVVVL